MKPIVVAAACVLPALSVTFLAGASREQVTQVPSQPAPKAEPANESKPKDLLDVTAVRIDGSSENLSVYKGKVVMVVNVASKCGLTPQYEALQKLYAKYKDDGLVILGFPANEFGSQEPGTNKEISEFCSSKYSVTFPMFEKVKVKGDGTHELFKRLAALPAPLGGEPKWNFTKWIVDRDGQAVARFEPKVKPDAEELVSKIETLLGKKREAGSQGMP